MATAVREARGLITAGTTTLHGTQALIASLVTKITALRSRPTVLLGAVVTTHHNPPTTRRVGEVTVRHVQPTAHLVGVVIAHPAEEGAAVGRVTAVVVEGGAPTVADTHAKRTLGLPYPAPTKRGWAALVHASHEDVVALHRRTRFLATWVAAPHKLNLFTKPRGEHFMKISHFITKAVAPVLSALLAVGVLFAFARTAAAQGDVDPPGRVARLNYAQGSVSFQPAGTKDWVDASPNRPLTTGDNLWSDDNSRGELHVGSTALRLSSQTGISFLNLNDQATQIQLAQGSLFLHVRELDENEAFEVDTPNIAFSILRPGTYRVTVDPDGNSTFVDVRSGGGEVTGGGSAYNLHPGQRYSFTGSDQLNYNTQGLPGRDDFDNWSASRDQREERSVSARYVSRDVMGYEDLDAYGSWSQDPEYGAVWMPRGVGAGWAPYHDGHWVYVEPWGWTWVGAEPWGFAPYHYGRWSVIRGSWGWIPGPVAVVVIGRPILRPVYAPALVGFVGGGGFSVSLVIGGGAGVAWFPLGPRDVWVPSYRCSPTYVQNVNIRNTRVVNVTQVTNVYNNVYINHNTTVVNNRSEERRVG